MTNACLRLAFASDRENGNHVSSRKAPFFLRAGGPWLSLANPPGFPRALPLVRFADRALRAFPTPLDAPGPENGP
jgi:hypothetical protein